MVRRDKTNLKIKAIFMVFNKIFFAANEQLNFNDKLSTTYYVN